MPNNKDNDELKKDPKEKNKKSDFRIPLTIVPNDAEALAEEMRAIFDEDKIVHRHGRSEPERD